MSDANDALEILELTLIPRSSPPIYAVGLAASRITLADQQRRAVNIIWALLREDRIKVDEDLAVVGGGVAGTTAAIYALQQGLRVTVFEKHGDAFPIQQGSGRWIHPGIYDWPSDGWRDADTNLPCMNWRAGTSGEVIERLRASWQVALQNDALRWLPRTEIVGFLPDGVTSGHVQDAAGNQHGPFRCIVLAVGFGEESPHPEIECRQYWRDDDLHQRIRDGGNALVSGCGDGGLIDAARTVLRDFRHDWLHEFASTAASNEHLVSELLRVERDVPAYPDGAALTQATLAVAVPGVVVEMVRDRLRPGTTVVLNGRSDGALTRAACILNRFLISQLIRLGVASYQAGNLEVASIRRNGAKFECAVDGVRAEFDLIVLRHGPTMHPLKAFPALSDALEPVRRFLLNYSAGVDRTRKRFWRPLPKSGTAIPGTLPPLAGDVLDFLGQQAQEVVQENLIRLNTLGTVSYERRDGGIGLAVNAGGRTHDVMLTISSRNQLSTASRRASGEERTFSIDLVSAVMADSGAAARDLATRLPEIVEWLVEEVA